MAHTSQQNKKVSRHAFFTCHFTHTSSAPCKEEGEQSFISRAPGRNLLLFQGHMGYSSISSERGPAGQEFLPGLRSS